MKVKYNGNNHISNNYNINENHTTDSNNYRINNYNKRIITLTDVFI